MTIDIDYSGIVGKTIECVPECGMCCLCQPEVLPEERSFFELEYPGTILKSEGCRFSLAMRNGKGSCVFLDKNRRCGIYQRRTTFCKQFPFHFYVGDKVSVELDLSCRGVWTGKGKDAIKEAETLAKSSETRLSVALREASAVYRDFYDICIEAGIMQDISALRASVHKNEKRFTEYEYIAKVMDLSLEESAMGLDNIVSGSDFEMEELEAAARDSALESMASKDLMSVPIYCDEGWNWNIFLATRNAVKRFTMDTEGDMHQMASVDVDMVGLKELDEGGREVLVDYIKTLNGRDSFLGGVFYNIDEFGYEDNMSNAYFGSLCVTIIDLLWRASMLDCFFGTGMGERGIKEAIIFYDMDRLDAPTIGAMA